MAEQETLLDDQPQGTPFIPVAHSLWTRFVDDGTVRHFAWLEAVRDHLYVGTCGACGDYLVPLPPDHVGKRVDYEARCRSEAVSTMVGGQREVSGCGQIVLLPGGRVQVPTRPQGV